MIKPLLCGLVWMALLPLKSEAQELLPKRKTLGEKDYAVVKVSSSADALYLLKTDSVNVAFNSDAMQTIKPDWIKSVSVLKDKPAIEEFGTKGKNGVVLIELKAEHEQAFLKVLKEQDINLAGGTKPLNIRLYCAAPLPLGEPLYIIQTKSGEVEVSKQDISGINPEWIKSIEVLKDAETIKRYKDQGKYGVILITFAPEKEQEVLQKIKNNN